MRQAFVLFPHACVCRVIGKGAGSRRLWVCRGAHETCTATYVCGGRVPRLVCACVCMCVCYVMRQGSTTVQARRSTVSWKFPACLPYAQTFDPPHRLHGRPPCNCAGCACWWATTGRCSGTRRRPRPTPCWYACTLASFPPTLLFSSIRGTTSLIVQYACTLASFPPILFFSSICGTVSLTHPDRDSCSTPAHVIIGLMYFPGSLVKRSKNDVLSTKRM